MIQIVHSKAVDPDLVISLKQFFEKQEETVQCHVRGKELLNAGEWALPALVTLWITKSFFDGFLKEAGKGSATVLKAHFSQICSRLRGTLNRFYNASDLQKVVGGASQESVGRQGPTLKIVVNVQSSDGSSKTSISYIVPDGLSDIEIEVATSTMIDSTPALLDDRSKFLDDHANRPIPLTMVYDKEDGWLSATELIEREVIQRQSRREQQ